MRRAALPALLALLAAACGSPVEDGPAAPTTVLTTLAATGSAGATGTRPEPTLPPGLETVPPSSITTGVTGEVPADLLTAVRADLAERTGASSTDMALFAAESVTWPDGALGCPRPGEAYLPSPTPGYRVVLQVAGTAYDYRLTAAGSLRLCSRLPGASTG